MTNQLLAELDFLHIEIAKLQKKIDKKGKEIERLNNVIDDKKEEIERLQKENNDLRKLYQRTYKHLFEKGNDELARYFQAQIDECPTFYVEPIIDYYEENKRLKSIIKEVREYIDHAQSYGTMAQVMPHLKPYVNGDDVLEILDKVKEKQ